jgi:hypothetical protein
MAVENNKETCNYCRFFVDNDRMGVCNRFPESVNKHMNNWCGEFQASNRKPKAQIEVIPAIQVEVQTKSYDIATDTITSMVEAITAKPSPEPVKKPGRPKKVVK